MNRCLAAPVYSLLGEEKLPEHVEQKLIQDEEIFRLKIDYPKMLEFDKGTELLERIADFGMLSGLGNVSGKSPLRTYYDYAFSHEPIAQKRPRFRDHGIVSALLLLRLWFDFRKYLDRFMTVKDNGLLNRISQELKVIHNQMTECEKSVVATASAIALHNT